MRPTNPGPPLSFLTKFFSYGQVLPTHRSKHSPHGGLFQPSIAEAIRILSRQPFHKDPNAPPPPLTYTTTGTDCIPAPSAYHRNRHGWVHVFPEGLVHQHPSVDLRYFKWGVARLILESEPAPEIVPMFIDGNQYIMPEFRTFPRFLPRIGKRIKVAFGDVVDYEATFGDLRRKWQALVARETKKTKALPTTATSNGTTTATDDSSNGVITQRSQTQQDPASFPLGELPDSLKYSKEAEDIRIEVARRMREEVAKVRSKLGGYPESDPKLGEAATWKADDDMKQKKYKSMVDGSDINQD